MNIRNALGFCCLLLFAGCTTPVPPEMQLYECKDASFAYYCKQDQFCGQGQCLEGSDVNNCGAVGNVCAINALCQNGRCVCKAGDVSSCGNGFVCCAGQCVDTNTNSQFCGSCSVACTGGKACLEGSCSDDCSQGLSKCMIAGISNCIDTTNNPLHCGSCDNVCNGDSVCMQGKCSVVCPSDQTPCINASGKTECVSLLQNPNNCGKCGHACTSELVCSNGVCSLTCPPGQDKCPGTQNCIDLQNNTQHCGACGNACPSGNVCINGKCALSCPVEQELCVTTEGNKCANVATDPSHCGKCGVSCPSTRDPLLHIETSSCANSQCIIQCINGYIDADGNIMNGCEQSSCGNGIVEEGEECDGEKLNDQTCETQMGEGSTGTLKCNASCTDFDTRSCSKPTTCGNSKLDNGEVCDTHNLNNQTCASILGKGSTGTLKCSPNCTMFDTSGCTAPTTCNNSKIDTGEDCDGTKFKPLASCSSVVGLGSTGSLKCSSNCTYDISACTTPSVCGNGKLEVGEECDGPSFGGNTCASLIGKGSSGQLVCSNCKISTKNCSAASTCGNNKTDGVDICDGSDVNHKTCKDIVGIGSTGVLRCAQNCNSYDITSCTAPATCGNDLIEATEVCDKSKLNDKTCATEMGAGYTGTLKCNNTCTGFDTSSCIPPKKCGNNTIDAGEVCDGTKFKTPVTCESEVGTGSKGIVVCGTDCTYYDLHGCSAPNYCNNGTIDAGEVCDGTKLDGATCASVVGKGSTGTLQCGADCKSFNTSKCSESEYCGDGKIQSGEVCDGANVGAATCESVVGYGSTGKPGCNKTCSAFEAGTCTPEVKCGNGKMDPGEVCDTSYAHNPFLGATCTSLVGYGSEGTLSCQACSKIVTTSCSPEIKCGNGKVDSGEKCDFNLPNSFGSATCESLIGFGSEGILTCNLDCTINTTGCSPEVKCGNGKLEEDIEECDASYKTNPFNGETCASVVGKGSTGFLACTETCEIDADGCSASNYCGNGNVDGDEACDKKNFRDGISTCKAYNPSAYGQGNLTCNDNCTINTSACASKCGDGVLQTGEECDDAGASDGDGCSATCTFEEGWVCKQARDGITACTPNWCNFQWLEVEANTLDGYSRVYPATLAKPGDIVSRLICGFAADPANTWTLGAEIDGEQNLGCAWEECGVNWEFMVLDLPKPETDGDYACSMQYSVDATHWFACPKEPGVGGPDSVWLVEDGDVLTDNWIRTFRVGAGGGGGGGGACDASPEVIRAWSFDSSSGSDPTITRNNVNYTSDATRVIYGQWTTSSTPDESEYARFAAGAIHNYCALSVAFNYSRNSSGPQKMIVSYYDGDRKLGQSEEINVSSTASAGVETGDLIVPAGNYTNFIVQINGYGGGTGTLRIRDLTIKGTPN